ncbi:MAG: hypothetical protein LRY54_00905 [Alphaproteobacteria bacterium]|nr:hypothetical protein [Alphaproteobacteria bacterium]
MTSLSPTGTYEPPVSGHYLDTIKLEGLDLFFNTAAMDATKIEQVRIHIESAAKDKLGQTASCTERKSLHTGAAILSINGLGEKTYRDIFNILNDVLPTSEGYTLNPTDLAIRDGACIINVEFSTPAAEQ